MTNNEAYWTERALKRAEEAYLHDAALTAKLFQEYESAAKAIKREISAFYSKYAGKYGLTYDQAVRLLNRKEFQEWKASLAEYVDYIATIQDPKVKALLTAQLDALSANSSISRLEALQGQIDLILNDLFDKGVAQMKNQFGDDFVEGYYKKCYDLQSRAGFFNEIAKIDYAAIENVVSYPWSGAMFSDRLWQNKQALLFNTREVLTQGLIQGKSVNVMSSALAAKMGQSYKNAERLVRTETAHIHAESDRAAYKEAGVEQYEFMATLEVRTCDVCGSLDGKHFKVSEAKVGVNYPPIHPNCRCTTVEYDPDDALDWYNSGQPMPKAKTYEEWYDEQVARNGQGLIKFTELINKQFTIAGTSAAGIDAAMLQLTQAMSSGVLRGEELNSVFEQAPTIIQTIADYLDVPIGKIRDMAADGQITSTIVKNAMLASADEINAKFESMPMTFAQVWTIAKNIALEAFTPVIQAIGSGAQWIYDNWSTIAPIFWGLASAALAYAVALGIQTAATWIADGAAKAFFTTLLTNPLFWIALAVGVVVAALYRMIQAVGGVKNAWEICKAALVVAWAALKVAFFATYNWIANLIDKLKLCWQRAGVAIAGYMGDMKVNVLTILQNMVNGAIDIINKFIGLLNKIPGVSIDAVEQVTFATTAKAENEAAKQARADALNKYESDIKAAQAQRDATYSAAKKELADATAALSKTYANAKAEAAQAKSDVGATDWNVDGTNDVGKVDSVGSVGKIDSDVNIADEDLKFLRDVAEMRYVQNFVTLTPTVAVEAQISEKVDVDEVVERIESKLEDEFTAAAEGVYN